MQSGDGGGTLQGALYSRDGADAEVHGFGHDHELTYGVLRAGSFTPFVSIARRAIKRSSNSTFYGFGISALVVDDAGQSTVMAQRGEGDSSSFYLWRVASDGSLAWERSVTSDHDTSEGSLVGDAAGNLTAATYTRAGLGFESLIQRFDANGELRWSHTLIGNGGRQALPLTVDRISGRVFVITREKLDELGAFDVTALSTLSSDGQRCDGYEYARPSDHEIVKIARGTGTDLYMLLSQGLVRYSGLRP